MAGLVGGLKTQSHTTETKTMVSIKKIAEGLSKQIEQAIEGKSNVAQAMVLCKSVDTLVSLAKLQLEMAQIDWGASDEVPVIEMEKASASAGDGPAKAMTATALCAPVKKTEESQAQVKTPPLNQSVQKSENLNQTESNQTLIGLGERLMNWIYTSKKAFGPREIAEKISACDELDTVQRDLGYWASKGHLEKTGSGALASYRVVDREFFKPKSA